MLRLKITNDAVKFLDGLERKHAGQIALKMIGMMQSPKLPDARPVQGTTESYFRVTVGEYRIVYRVVGEILDVILIGKRDGDDVYKQLKRLGL